MAALRCATEAVLLAGQLNDLALLQHTAREEHFQASRSLNGSFFRGRLSIHHTNFTTGTYQHLSHHKCSRAVTCCVQSTPSPSETGSKKEAPSNGIPTENGGNIKPVVVIDNYDSFTYNLCQYLGNLGCHYVVYRNDEITVDELLRLEPRGVLISPGPGTPDDSGISLEVVQRLGASGVPLFGVCMGLQCMGQAYGGNIVRAPGGVMHGKTSPVFHSQQDGAEGLMAGLPNPFTACRYHSLVIDKATFPEGELEVTAWTEDGLVMGVRHRRFRYVEGVQFHPESIITQSGMNIVENFVKGLERREQEEAASRVG